MKYQKWAFRLTIWQVIIQIIIFSLIVNYVPLTFLNNQSYVNGIANFQIVSFLLLLATVFCIVLSIIRKEPKKYRFWIAVAGLLCLFLPLLYDAVM